MTATTAPLQLGQAVELAHAWLQAFCDRRGIRVLFIKGPGLAHHGLRPPRVSSDVDVLVDPGEFERLCRDLSSAGWRRRPATYAGEMYTLHSRAFLSPAWPCDIDVHTFYPGFLAPPQEVFDHLWSRRTTMPLAHVECSIPDRLSSILILGLHSLRSKQSDSRHASELHGMLRSVSLDESERTDLYSLATVTGAEDTTADILLALGVDVRSPQRDDSALREWKIRVQSGATPTSMWLLLFRRASGRERVRIVRHAVWPSRSDLLLMYPGLPDTASARLTARMRRLGRGARALPRALWVALTARFRR